MFKISLPTIYRTLIITPTMRFQSGETIHLKLINVYLQFRCNVSSKKIIKNINKLTQKYHTVGGVLKSNRKIVEMTEIDIHNTHIKENKIKQSFYLPSTWQNRNITNFSVVLCSSISCRSLHGHTIINVKTYLSILQTNQHISHFSSYVYWCEPLFGLDLYPYKVIRQPFFIHGGQEGNIFQEKQNYTDISASIYLFWNRIQNLVIFRILKPNNRYLYFYNHSHVSEIEYGIICVTFGITCVTFGIICVTFGIISVTFGIICVTFVYYMCHIWYYMCHIWYYMCHIW